MPKGFLLIIKSSKHLILFFLFRIQLAVFPECQIALEARKMVDNEQPVKMIDLVLQCPG